MIALLSLPFMTPAGWLTLVVILLGCLAGLAFYTLVLYRRLPKHYSLLIGQTATVVAWQDRDHRVELFGAIWQACLPDGHAALLQMSDSVRVTHVRNLVLTVIPSGEK